MLTSGRRTTVPRRRTISATLDWSYGLLTEIEQTVLRRLGIFRDGFTFRATGAVAADAARSESEIIDHVAELVAKSLVAADGGGAEPRLWLLETTRAYALKKLAESGERDILARRHVEYTRNLLASAAQAKAAAVDRPAADAPESDNLRAALAWAFVPGGDPSVGGGDRGVGFGCRCQRNVTVGKGRRVPVLMSPVSFVLANRCSTRGKAGPSGSLA